ncbi:MAG: FMN-binding protein [Ignavibacterium sp.]|nr:FMN-binding protein [Ignavibacterium sp.]
MIIKILFIVIFSFVAYSQNIKEKVNISLENCFGKNIQIDFEKLKLKNELKNSIEKKVGQKFYSDEVYLYKISFDKKIIGYGLLDNVYGKSLPITFLVMFDSTGKILCSEIVKYREPYGGAIQSKEWNDQFKGKNVDSEFIVGKDVSGISGATISVNSVNKGIKKLTLLLSEIILK